MCFYYANYPIINEKSLLPHANAYFEAKNKSIKYYIFLEKFTDAVFLIYYNFLNTNYFSLKISG